MFAGQRWVVQDLDEQTKTLVVAPHPGGVVPRFEPAAGEAARSTNRPNARRLSWRRRSTIPRRQGGGVVSGGEGNIPDAAA